MLISIPLIYCYLLFTFSLLLIALYHIARSLYLYQNSKSLQIEHDHLKQKCSKLYQKLDNISELIDEPIISN